MTREGGSVLWITGLSGAGKTTIANAAASLLRAQGSLPIVLDGDDVRAAIDDPYVAHDPRSRLANAYRICRLAKLFASQGHRVIVATMSLFHEVHAWNRLQLPAYFEVFLDTDLDELRARDTRGLYGESTGDVVGLDLPFEAPREPHHVVRGDRRDPAEIAREVLDAAGWSVKELASGCR